MLRQLKPLGGFDVERSGGNACRWFCETSLVDQCDSMSMGLSERWGLRDGCERRSIEPRGRAIPRL